MAYKQKGFTPFTQDTDDDKIYYGGVLPEVEVTAKHTKKSRRLAEDRAALEELHENPVIKGVHGATEKAADVIKKGVGTGATLALAAPIGIVGRGTAAVSTKIVTNPKTQKLALRLAKELSSKMKKIRKTKFWKDAKKIPTVSSSDPGRVTKVLKK